MEPSLPHIPSRGSRSLVLVAAVAAGMAVASLAAGLVPGRAAPANDVLSAQRERVRALEAQVGQIDAAAAAAADARAAAEAHAADLRRRIGDTTASIGSTERAHTAAVTRLAQRLRMIYAEPTPTLPELLVSAGSITDALDAEASFAAVSRGDAAVVGALRASRERLRRLRAELVLSQGQVQTEVRASRARLAQLRALIAGRRAALAGARSQLGALQRRAAIAADRARARALLRRARRAVAPGTRSAAGAAGAVAPPAPPVPSAATSPAATPARIPPASGDVASALQRIAQCESGGDPRAVSPSGTYRGKYQFDQGTWNALGGAGDPAAAPEAEQDRIAAILYARSGPAPWPVCGYR